MSERQNSPNHSEILNLIKALIKITDDESPIVTECLIKTMKTICDRHLNDVLEIIFDFSENNTDIPDKQRTNIFQLLNKITEDKRDRFSNAQQLQLVQFCMVEFRLSENLQTQMKVADILQILSLKNNRIVIEALVNELNSTRQVKSSIIIILIYALANLANYNRIDTFLMPHMTNIINRLIFLMELLRDDISKQTLSKSFSQYCEYLHEHKQSTNQAIDENILNDLSTGYNILVKSWAQSKNTDVVDSVLYAIDSSLFVMSDSKLTEEGPKLIAQLLAMLKKSNNPQSLTYCLNSAIIKIGSLNLQILQTYLDNILNGISDQIELHLTQDTRPELLKNHSQILRCYEYLSVKFFDKVYAVILSMAKGYEKEKIKMMIITAHLITANQVQITEKVSQLMDIYRSFLNDNSVRVKRTLIKVIMTLAQHSYLDEDDSFIMYLFKLASIRSNEANADLAELKKISESSLELLTTVESLENNLWRKFMESLLHKEYRNARFVILKCLLHLVQKKYTDFTRTRRLDDNYHTMPDAIEPEVIMLRILLLLKSKSSPENYSNVFLFLKAYSFFINVTLLDHWNEYHRNNTKIKINEFISSSIRKVDDAVWVRKLGTSICDQITAQNLSIAEILLLVKILSIVLTFETDEFYVGQKIDLILSSVKNCTNYNEITKMAKYLSRIGKSHCQITLRKLHKYRSDELQKKSNLLNFHSIFNKEGRQISESEKSRYLLVAAYEFIISEISSIDFENLEKSLETDILKWMFNELKNAKDSFIRKRLLQALDNICKVVFTQKTIVLSSDFRLSTVQFMISNLLQIHSGADCVELFPTILFAIKSILTLGIVTNTALDPIQLLDSMFEHIFNGVAIYCKLSNIGDSDAGTESGNHKLSSTLLQCIDILNSVVLEVFAQFFDLNMFANIFRSLEIWIRKPKSEQRWAALKILCQVLEYYLNNMRFVYEATTRSHQIGYIVGKLVPRCSDTMQLIRKLGVQCIFTLLSIGQKFQSNDARDGNLLVNFKNIENSIESTNRNTLSQSIILLVNTIGENMSRTQCVYFVESLIECLNDDDDELSVDGCALSLKIYMESWCNIPECKADEIFNKILDAVKPIEARNSRMFCLKGVQVLALYHSNVLFPAILSKLPFNSFLADFWTIMSRKPKLTRQFFEYAKNIFLNTPITEERNKVVSATVLPYSIVSALQIVFETPQTQEIIQEYYTDFLMLLLINCGCYINVRNPVTLPDEDPPLRLILVCLRKLLTSDPDPTNELYGDQIYDYSKFKDSKAPLQFYSRMVQNISTYLSHNEQLPVLVKTLDKYASSPIESHRVLVASVFMSMTNIYLDQPLLQHFLTQLIAYQTDSSSLVRLDGLIGLLHFHNYHYDTWKGFSAKIVSILVDHLDESDTRFNVFDTSIPLTALEGLMMIFENTSRDRELDRFRITIGIRIQTFFVNCNPELRSKSIRLFGTLVKLCDNDADTLNQFDSVIHSNFVCFLAHLNDEFDYVRISCKFTLKILLIALNIVPADFTLDSLTFNYKNFLGDIIPLMATKVPEKMPLYVNKALDYMKTQWFRVRFNSAMILGQLAANLSAGIIQELEIGRVLKQITRFTTDSHSEIRTEALLALNSLFKHEIR